MEKKQNYVTPSLEIINFDCEDIITTSGENVDLPDDDIWSPDVQGIPPADIRQLRDLVRYRWKLTNFKVGEKNRAQNCLTVSNIKLDDVFSDVFGKASTNIISRLLENPAKRITNVSSFRTKGMKATDDELLAALDGEICPEQAEKLRIRAGGKTSS